MKLNLIMPNSKQKSIAFFSIKELTYLALFTAACVVGRLFFQFIPNFQPMTAIFLIVATQLGVLRSLIVSILSVVITSIYLGMGIWTVEQVVAYAIILLVFYLLYQYAGLKKSLVLQILFSFLMGLLYGFIFSVMDFFLYGMSQFLPYYSQGLLFDLLHGLGNALFYGVLFPVIAMLLKRYPKFTKKEK